MSSRYDQPIPPGHSGLTSKALVVAGLLALAVFAFASRTARTGSFDPPAPARTAAAAPTTRTSGTARLSLLSQSPWVMPATPGSPATFSLGLSVTHRPSRTQLGIDLTVYTHLITRYSFDQTLSGTAQGTALYTSPSPIPLSCLPDLGIVIDTSYSQVIRSTGSAQSLPCQPIVNLACTPSTGTCPGVYPVSVALVGLNSSEVVARLTTYLTYSESPSPTPLRFGLIVPFGAPPSAAARHYLEAEAASLSKFPTTPLTVLATPQTVQTLTNARTPGALQAVKEVSALSNGPIDQFPAQSYVPVNISTLSSDGLGAELSNQIATGAQVLAAAGVRTSRGTWVNYGPVGAGLGAGLADVAANHIVLAQNSVTPVNGVPLSSAAAQTFELLLPHTTPIAAAAADSGLSSQFNSASKTPVLAANQFLAALALVHFEEPSYFIPRGVVALPPTNWTPNPVFISTLLSGLKTNPNVSPVTLNQFFAAVPTTGANGAPIVQRAVYSGNGSTMTPAFVSKIQRSRQMLTSFDSAVSGTPNELSRLNDQLLSSESTWFSEPTQIARVKSFRRSLAAQLALVQLATDRTITLTAQSGAIPVSVLSSAPYTIKGTLTLVSNKFTFPNGPSKTLVLNRPTNPVRINARARTSGDLPVQVTLVAPRGGLVIAKGQLIVRSTATSIVGILLTLIAACVLLAWWARTWRGRPGTDRRQMRATTPQDPGGVGDPGNVGSVGSAH